jgi:glycosyltransferase involved in cell wall biosynthesis
MIWTLIAIITAAGWIILLISGCKEILQTPLLEDQPEKPPPDKLPKDKTGWPGVRVVCAARNEAKEIEAAVRSWMRSDYSPLEVVVVDDRSTDDTGKILDSLSKAFPNLIVRHVDLLPDGWLGKNNALQAGAEDASADWILFTDADVRFHPAAIKKAVAFAEARRIDHLAAGPGIPRKGWVLASVISFFSLLFGLFIRPYKAADPKSPAHVGIGAFNLVRGAVYRKIGGHRAIRLRPDDDLKLGWLIKRSGFRQRFASAKGLIEVDWYHSLGEMTRGLEKNVFAPFDYSLTRVALLGPVYLWIFYLPFLGLVLGDGFDRALFGVACLAMLGLSLLAGRANIDVQASAALAVPFSATLFLCIFLRAVFLTVRRGGIRWRDHFYSLDELRRNRV